MRKSFADRRATGDPPCSSPRRRATSIQILETTNNHKPFFIKHWTGFCLSGWISHVLTTSLAEARERIFVQEKRKCGKAVLSTSAAPQGRVISPEMEVTRPRGASRPRHLPRHLLRRLKAAPSPAPKGRTCTHAHRAGGLMPAPGRDIRQTYCVLVHTRRWSRAGTGPRASSSPPRSLQPHAPASASAPYATHCTHRALPTCASAPYAPPHPLRLSCLTCAARLIPRGGVASL
jgi:hypothetical protein